MATEKLIVKNFGPIKDAELDLKKVTVLIGEQASGKSVLAKLAGIFSGSTAPQGVPDYEFDDYHFEQYFTDTTYFDFENKFYHTFGSKNKFNIKYFNEQLNSIIKDLQAAQQAYFEVGKKIENQDSEDLYTERRYWSNIVSTLLLKLSIYCPAIDYIPAERIITSLIQTNYEYLSLRRRKSSLEGLNFFQKFFSKYTNLKSKLKSIDIPILNIKFNSVDKEEFITLESGLNLKGWEVSSGIHSLIPIYVFIEGDKRSKQPTLFKEDESSKLFIIEEPELNLYPNTQKELLKYLIENCTKGDNRLIITTHSPYILSSLNNLIQANNVVKKNPELADEVARVVPPQYHIDFEDVAAYFVANGTAKSIMNSENQLIDANALDEVSNDISEEFGKLIQLEFQNETL